MALNDSTSERFYQDLFTLTSRPEWKQFIDYCGEMLENKRNNAIEIDTVEDLYREKGQVDILRMIVSFRDVIETQYQFLQVEENHG